MIYYIKLLALSIPGLPDHFSMHAREKMCALKKFRELGDEAIIY